MSDAPTVAEVTAALDTIRRAEAALQARVDAELSGIRSGVTFGGKRVRVTIFGDVTPLAHFRSGLRLFRGPDGSRNFTYDQCRLDAEDRIAAIIAQAKEPKT